MRWVLVSVPVAATSPNSSLFTLYLHNYGIFYVVWIDYVPYSQQVRPLARGIKTLVRTSYTKVIKHSIGAATVIVTLIALTYLIGKATRVARDSSASCQIAEIAPRVTCPHANAQNSGIHDQQAAYSAYLLP